MDSYLCTIADVTAAVMEGSTFRVSRGFNQLEKEIEAFLKSAISGMFPSIPEDRYSVNVEYMERSASFSDSFSHLLNILHSVTGDKDKSLSLSKSFMEKIPQIFAILETDAKAAYMGDPACKSVEEAVLCYPGFFAVCVFRIAHELYLSGVDIIPRMMTEYAHKLTGIDIHPGATIGESFFIDHGTGVVIGETTVIGNNVKIYQNVTLGAKNFKTNPDGTPVKNIKRHPNIGNNVVIYAGATILGGDTFVGDNCIVGANVWLSHSIAASSVVKNAKA